MRNRYRFVFFCCFLSALFTLPALGQTNFRPGYVLPPTGDTLRGEVDSREGRLNGQRCRFRAAPQAETTTYLPNQLRGYGFSATNQHYRSLPVALGASVPQPYYLEVLADGPAKLYFLRDAEQRDNYFVVSAAFPLTILEHSLVQTSNGNDTRAVVQTSYRNTLSAALRGCEAAQRQLPRLSFQESALLKVVNTYNTQCAGVQVAQPKSSRAALYSSIGIMAGVVRHTLSYNGYPYSGAANVRSTHAGVAVGPVLKLRTGRLGQRVALVAALLYEPEKHVVEGLGVRVRQTFDLAYLRMPLMMRYTYPRGKVAPFAEAGFSISYAVKAENSAEQVDRNGNRVGLFPFAPGSSSNDFRATQTGVGVGLGVETHIAGGRALALLLRAEKANGFHRAYDVGTSVVHLYGLLSFDLTN